MEYFLRVKKNTALLFQKKYLKCTWFKSVGARLLVATRTVPVLNNLLRIPDNATIAKTSTVCHHTKKVIFSLIHFATHDPSINRLLQLFQKYCQLNVVIPQNKQRRRLRRLQQIMQTSRYTGWCIFNNNKNRLNETKYNTEAEVYCS